VAWAQKPPAPAPPPSAPPPGAPSGRSPASFPPGTPPSQPRGDVILYLQGRVATDDGTPVPHDVLIERVCGARVRQQEHASSGGDFTMQLGTRTDSYVDATASGDENPTRAGQKNSAFGGIPRLDLTNCEIRATVSGFRSNSVNLMDLTPTAGGVDVGAILMHRTTKAKGATVSAASYLAPKDAKKAYESGLAAEKH